MIQSTAYIGLGSNLPSPAGSPEATLGAAISRLDPVGRVLARSSFYETAPVGYVDQPPFVNAAVALATALAPLELLDRMLAIEREFGRDRSRGPAKGPRTLDLDLLLVDALVFDHPRLALPHPELARRRFVLAPLAEIAPATIHPVLGKTVVALLRELPAEGTNGMESVNIMKSAV